MRRYTAGYLSGRPWQGTILTADATLSFSPLADRPQQRQHGPTRRWTAMLSSDADP